MANAASPLGSICAGRSSEPSRSDREAPRAALRRNTARSQGFVPRYRPIGAVLRRALSRKPGRKPAAYPIGCRHGPALLPPPSLPARDHPARDLALSPLHPELPRCRGTPGRTRARYLLRNGAAMGAEVRSRDRWHLDEMVVRIAGKRTYLWRAVDDEGEVLDMLVQRRRDGRAALRLMRKLLKKQGFVPKLLVTDKLRSYASAFRRLRLTCRHEQGLRKNTIGWRIRIRQSDDASASCSGSSRLDRRCAFSACTVRFTTPSTSNATSSPDPHCGSSGPKRPHSGEMPSQRHDAW